MLEFILLVLAGFAMLYLGGEGLVRGAAALALRFGLSPLVVGLTVVAFGTSAPELVVTLQAALSGNGALAIGNVVGSNIANFAFILGIAALIAPLTVDAKLFRLDVPLMIGGAVVMVLLLSDSTIGRVEGIALTAVLVVWIGASLWIARREKDPVKKELEEASKLPAPKALWLDLVFVGAGVALLIFGGDFFVRGAVGIARALDVSDTVVGLTVVAIGTSLPELATSIIAAARNQGDIAVGNVIGSNIFNTFAILGITSTVQPLTATDVTAVDFGVMIGLLLLSIPLMRSGFKLARWEGAVLLLVYVGYLTWLVLSNTGVL